LINLCLSSSNNQKLQQKKLKEEKATCRCDQVIHNYGASETLCLTKQSSHNLTRGSHKPVSCLIDLIVNECKALSSD
jgi:hypothetical protein